MEDSKDSIKSMLRAHEQLDNERFRTIEEKVTPIADIRDAVVSMQASMKTLKWVIGISIAILSLNFINPNIHGVDASAKTMTESH